MWTIGMKLIAELEIRLNRHRKSLPALATSAAVVEVSPAEPSRPCNARARTTETVDRRCGRRRLTLLSAVCWCLCTALAVGIPSVSAAQPPGLVVVLDFEDQPDAFGDPRFNPTPLPASYRGVAWSGFLHYAPYTINGYTPRGVNAIYAAGFINPTFSFATPQEFVGAYFSAPSLSGPPRSRVYFEMSLAGRVVARSSDLSSGQEFLVSGYSGPVDSVRVITVGPLATSIGSAWVMDDVTFKPSSVVDCAGSWGAWQAGPWSACIGGQQSRTETRVYNVTTPASGGGQACPAPETRTVGQSCVSVVTRNDLFGLRPDLTLSMPAPGVIANDFLNGSTTATAVLVQPATMGVVALRPDGGFTYTPPPPSSFSWPVTFKYKLTDALTGDSNEATVTLGPSCGGIGPIKTWDALGGSQKQQQDAQRLEDIEDLGSAQKQQVLVSEGWVTASKIDPVLASEVVGFRNQFLADTGVLVPYESGYRSVTYQRHFRDLFQIREDLYSYVYADPAMVDQRLAECRPLIDAVRADARGRHGIVISSKQKEQRRPSPDDFGMLAVSNPDLAGNATHPLGQGVDLGQLRDKSPQVFFALKAWNSRPSRPANAPTLDRPFLKSTNDFPHFGLVTGPNSMNSILIAWSSPGTSITADAGLRASPAVVAGEARLLVTDPLGRRVGITSSGAVVNEVGSSATFAGPRVGTAIQILEAVPGNYTVEMQGATTGPGLLEVVRNGEERNRISVASSAVAGAATSPVSVILSAATADTVAPVVQPPASVTVMASSASGILVSGTPELARFLAAGAAIDDFDPEPVLYRHRIGPQVLDSSTLLPVGEHVVTFEFSDATGNVGSAESRVTVVAPVAGAPAVPVLSASVQGTRVSAAWGPGAGGGTPASYRLLVGTRPGLADVAALNLGGLTSGQGDLPVGSYYLRVEATNPAGTTPSNEVRVDVGGLPPGAPVLDATVNGQDVGLRWSPGAGPAPTSYILQVGSQSGAADIASLPLGAQTTIAGALPVGTYFTRVVGATAAGTAVSNEVILRTTCAAPAAPADLTATVAGGRVTLAWPPVAGATSFRLQAGATPGAANLFDGNVGTATSLAAAPPRGTYHVRVLALGACGSSAPSPERTVVVP